MHSPSFREGAHSMLNTIVEGFDEENYSNSVPGSPKHGSEPDGLVHHEEDLRSRLRRDSTESLISNLCSLKPMSIVDSRLIEDLTKEKLKVSIRNLLTEVNRTGKESDALYRINHPGSIALTFIATGSTRPRRSSTHRARTSSMTSGVDAGRDREIIPELRIRDLRQLESHFNHHEEPYVLIRRHCVLISLGPHVRVIVQSKRLMILVPQDEEQNQSQTLLQLLAHTVQDLMKNSRMGSELSSEGSITQLPFEVKAYCALFSMYHSLLTKEYNTLLGCSKSMISSISDHTMLSFKLQEFMHTNHDNVVDLQSRILGTRKMVETLLEYDDELLFMNLKVLDANPALYGLPTDEAVSELYASFPDIESIIESFLQDFRALENQTDVLVRKLTHVEQSINLKLDTSRNELLFATTILSVFATVISFSGYITGVFGMNLDNTETIQSTPGVFYAVFGSTLFMIAMGAVLILLLFRFYHILPSHAHLHKGVESGAYTRPGMRKGSLEASTKNLQFIPS